MTEQEAKVTFCPLSFAPLSIGRPHPNFPGHMQGEYHGGLQSTCIGSACMAWRWDREGWSLRFDENGPVIARQTTEAHGYCGLAGKP